MRTLNPTPAVPIDAGALAMALHSLGICYGAERPLAESVTGAADEAQALRAYIRRERPHLLKAYDLETLVGIVLAARAASTQAPAAIETYGPA